MFLSIQLPGPIVLVPGKPLDAKLRKQAGEYPGFPTGLGRVVADLRARTSGVPATLQSRDGDGEGRLQLYTGTYCVLLFASGRGDAYTVAAAWPLRLQDHDRLARGCLLLRADWRVVAEHRQIPPGVSARWRELSGAWQQLQAESGDRRRVPVPDPAHTAFLDSLDRLNSITQRLAVGDASETPRYLYRSAEPVGERRPTASPVYAFSVVGDRVPARGEFVRLDGAMDQRGQVLRAEHNVVTVRFDQDLDWDGLAQQGQLEVITSNVVHAKRREAVARLRDRQSRHKSLLSVMVDHRVVPIMPVDQVPGEELDEDQLLAFRKALGVSDLLVVLGPPGTGKTRTISQIARTSALTPAPGPVLVASHTNRAVDNVLARLPRDLVIVRVGHEGKVDPDAKPFLLEALAADLRGQIVATTGSSIPAYDDLPLADQWANELGRRVGALRAAFAEQRTAGTELGGIRRALAGPAQVRLDEVRAELARYERGSARRHQKLVRASERAARARGRRRRLPLLRAWAERRMLARDRRIAAMHAELEARQRETERLAAVVREAGLGVEIATRDLPEVLAAVQRLREAEWRTSECRAAAHEAARAIRSAVQPVEALPLPADNGDVGALLSGWEQLLTRLAERLPELHARAGLLREWNAEVSAATDQLYPELIRYADVIGATCIGSASRPELAGVDFDLAIVDEAGQIAMSDLLVPLVRAQRAVLVGDHRQLPPFADERAQAEAAEAGDSTVGRLLTHSALEALVGELPSSHVVQLTRQRRMPAVIADFISEAFYDGMLKTMVTRVHDDPLFTKPMAFVDTCRLPEATRSERRVGGREAGARGGIVNPVEASLLALLAGFYHRRKADWALIVPYAAQVKAITELVKEEIPDLDTIDGNIGTVDSFQGGERDVVLYGFTRSNPAGNVGFLDELRRANVAFTRARCQLVLVGDMDMLLRARSDRFRELAVALRDHIKAHGDVRQFRDTHDHLSRLRVQEQESA